MYSPMKYFGLAGPGIHIGIVGLGGLGHIGVRFAKAFGTKVTVVSSTAGKCKDALENLGADGFLVSTDKDQMQVKHKLYSNFQCLFMGFNFCGIQFITNYQSVN